MEKPCEICGTTITKQPTHSKATWEKVRFCSRTCMGMAKRRYPQGDKICETCGAVMKQPANRRGKSWADARFCSEGCRRVSASTRRKMSESHKARGDGKERMAYAQSFREYRPLTEEHKEKLRVARLGKMPMGEDHHNWAGDDASYSAIHHWIKRNWGHGGVCQWCGEERKTQWANLDGRYDRSDKTTWAELCLSCHKLHDLEFARQARVEKVIELVGDESLRDKLEEIL